MEGTAGARNGSTYDLPIELVIKLLFSEVLDLGLAVIFSCFSSLWRYSQTFLSFFEA